ncbi:MAG: putative toxin-antitoxin system toxin component, PIN family [Candidatus Raymondbacteria bacterium RifOxyA12_full_50_37]|uniref:Putative toxin-antitoxin system toxin component, PIN family n=1 Tax=Candidatus Raymondbacteria bacterium RIFOXYD12_FULL_49_13 TaxID=1817890 RepID=A0A1F7FH24_UNCRA|nr:MAG: putative toxin-antitoxin system toxin component, PIN family [Candidatus Raymondbacteria bacterium RifOxyA12_full_50_37]OGJ91685.1 MAG: putative toxin-antitoxin system toxin component, PIN family [Candidatus Raymondbacteria bacterium RIFOXYA2_FULL_49_16]OGJ98696.1 MAG: putative toxin-antitoxin system toxin component, PIN family [Candidatus Raymondbacteria bacterium RIFOXYC2_FULL_50_21]OGK02186.1 MAG: putative toxin-antitoxin system toxin component, PIN family [Candidatus Raymondbacteria b
MRIILDTNVLVSGIFFKGPPFRILETWKQSKIKIVASNSILEEYTRTIHRLSHQFPAIDVSDFWDLLTVKAEIVAEIVLLKPISRDKSDDKFLACALSSKVSIIVSGDDDPFISSSF